MVEHHQTLVLTLAGCALWGYSMGLPPALAALPINDTPTLDTFIRLHGRPP